MLFWEAENLVNWNVHHLMVLSYHLQHPSLYSQRGLEWGIKQLLMYLIEEISPEEMRKKMQAEVNSTNRNWNFRGTNDSRGSYRNPIDWEMTAADVVLAGPAEYRESVRTWAQSILSTFESTDNL